nr:SulP family inorganic anion transporter [Azomonas agilis]
MSEVLSMRFAGFQQTFSRDLLASLVVFLVALPLCMGVAIASGMPPAKGLVTGIIGGLVVGFLAGSPLQVSGPAAGLAVLVFELVSQHGIAALGPVLILAGIIQVAAGFARLGAWFRVTSPAVVYGMLSGIGILIVLSQIHVMLDATPQAAGLANLLAYPQALTSALKQWSGEGSSGGCALLLGLITIAIMWTWDKKRPHSLRFLPGALLGVTAATLISLILGLEVNRVDVPSNLGDAIDFVGLSELALLANPALLMSAIALAFIASAETLLSAAAVDRMHQGPRSDFDRELFSQGIGNFLCGLVTALPMTGVIVRSSANVQAGAKTRLSAILHGVWLLAFVVALPFVLTAIPVASLAGVLVYTGFKLADPSVISSLKRYGRAPQLVYVVTAVTIVCTDLLTGVLVGFILSLIQLAVMASRLKINIVYDPEDESQAELRMTGVATFLKVPKLSRALDKIKPGTTLHVPLDNLRYIDHACMELLEDWERSHQADGCQLVIGHWALKRRLEGATHKT